MDLEKALGVDCPRQPSFQVTNVLDSAEKCSCMIALTAGFEGRGLQYELSLRVYPGCRRAGCRPFAVASPADDVARLRGRAADPGAVKRGAGQRPTERRAGVGRVAHGVAGAS